MSGSKGASTRRLLWNQRLIRCQLSMISQKLEPHPWCILSKCSLMPLQGEIKGQWIPSVVGVSVYFASCSDEDQEVRWSCCSSLGLHHGVGQTSEWRGAVVQLVIWWCLCKRLFLTVLHVIIFSPGTTEWVKAHKPSNLVSDWDSKPQ